jgi:L-phenylalanine/L-methionine N-acetyltransferase
MIRIDPPAGVALRRAGPDDVDAFVAMMSDAAVYPGTMQLPYADAAVWRHRLSSPAAASGNVSADLLLVAVHDGQVIGSAGIHPAGPSVRRRHAMTLGITVTSAWQGQGVGQLLMTALCEHADRWLGLLRLELTVFVDNRRAIALYQRVGFEIEGTHRAYGLRDGVLVDVHSMARLHPNPPRLPSQPSNPSPSPSASA